MTTRLIQVKGQCLPVGEVLSISETKTQDTGTEVEHYFHVYMRDGSRFRCRTASASSRYPEPRETYKRGIEAERQKLIEFIWPEAEIHILKGVIE
jgi:hypothetical protein